MCGKICGIFLKNWVVYRTINRQTGYSYGNEFNKISNHPLNHLILVRETKHLKLLHNAVRRAEG